MPEAEFDAQLKTWGNSLGVVVPANVIRQLHAEAGASLHLVIRHEPGRNDPHALPKFNWGGKYDIDQILDEET